MPRFSHQPYRALAGLLALLCFYAVPAPAIDHFWDGSVDADFNDPLNWTPASVPTSVDAAFLQLNMSVTTTAFANVDSLKVSNGVDLFLLGGGLLVDGTTTVQNTNANLTTLQVFDTIEANDLDTNVLDVLDGGELDLGGGKVQVDVRMLVNAGSTVTGHGTIEFTSVGNSFVNDGTIIPDGGNILLTRTAGSGTTLNLDGNSGNGSITATSNTSSVTIDMPLSDPFGGTITIGDGNRVTFNDGWDFGVIGDLVLTGGVFGAATLESLNLQVFNGTMTVTGGQADILGEVELNSTVAVSVASGGTLSFEDTTTYEGGSYTGLGTIEQNATAWVSGPTTIAVSTINLDGDTGFTDWLITDNLTLNVGKIDTTNDFFDGTLRVDDGSLTVNNAANVWEMNGTLQFTSIYVGNNEGQILGDHMLASGDVDVNDEVHRILAETTFESTSTLDIETGATLHMDGLTHYQGGTYTGGGSLKHAGNAIVEANTTLGMDNVGFTSDVTVMNGSTLQLNADTLGSGNDTLGADFKFQGGAVSVNNVSNAWTLGTNGSMEFTAAGTTFNEVLGDKVNVAGAVDVLSGTRNRFNAVTEFQSTADVSIAASSKLTLLLATTYGRGTYAGAGELEQNGPATVSADTTISVARLDMDGSAGTTPWTITNNAVLDLNINQINDSGVLYDGVLTLNNGTIRANMAGDWRTDNTVISDGISGIGGTADYVAQGVLDVNSGTLTIGSPLIGFNTATNLDVAAGANLRLNGTTSYVDGAFTGGGTITQNGNAVFGSGISVGVSTYDWDGEFENSTTTVTSGGLFQFNGQSLDTNAGHDGLIAIDAGGRVEINTPLPWGIRTGTLRLGGAGATVGGSADLNVADSAGTIEGNGQILVDVTNNGTVRPGLSAGVISIVGNFTHELTGTLVVELGGTAATDYDLLDVSGTAMLHGGIDIQLINGFTPASGDVFRVLEYANVVDDFNWIAGNVFGAGPGQFFARLFLADHLSLYVPLQGDANFDGIVSGADFTIWADNFGSGFEWSHADFTGDGQVTGADYTVWADHFGQSVTLDPAPADLSWLTEMTFAPQATAVPEPGAWVLMLIGVAALGLRAAFVARRV